MKTAYALNGLGCNCQNRTLMGTTFSADEVVGKTLIAKKDIPVKTSAFDSAPVSYVVPAGQTVGVVNTWLNPTADRTSIYWVIERSAGPNVYVKHETGAFDVKALVQQGAQTTEEKVKEQKEEEQRQNDPWGYYIEKYAFKGLLIMGGIIIAKEAIGQFISAKARPAT